MKRYLSLILIFTIVLSAVPVLAENDFNYFVRNNGIVIRKYLGNENVVVIPDEIDGYPVTEIEKGAFSEKKFQKVVIGKNVVKIQEEAFYICTIEDLVMLNPNTEIETERKETTFSMTGEKWYIVFDSFRATWIDTIYAYPGGKAEEYINWRETDFVPIEDGITIIVDESKVETDTAPYIKEDRTLVPLRAIFEALGATVSWDDATKTAIGTKGDTEIKITIGENMLYKNGNAIELDCAAEITNDRTMAPVRAISEAFGCEVRWVGEAEVVKILTNDATE